MKEFNNLSFKLSKKITEAYSTSFSLGIKVFSKEYRNPIYAIYAFVRLADEIVDTFHNYDKHYLMNEFRKDTFEAIEMRISTNTVLNSFQKVVHDYNIDLNLIDAFLKSMEMDLSYSSYEKHQFDNYVFGSAEAVGLMCLRVFCNGDKKLYEELKYPAQQLGSAFQKVNFLRDIKSDLLERGRIYLPSVDHPIKIDDENKVLLEKEIEKEFSEALKGIKNLPMGVKLGVYSAYRYYYSLFNKIKKLQVKELLNRRVRISNFKKIALLLESFYKIRILKTT